jgi:hypothetical protein
MMIIAVSQLYILTPTSLMRLVTRRFLWSDNLEQQSSSPIVVVLSALR